MSQFLLAFALDFSSDNGFVDFADAIQKSLRPGIGGVVSSYASQLAIASVRHSSGVSDRQVENWEPAKGPDGWLTILAGRLQEMKQSRERLELPPTASDALVYAHAHAKYGSRCDKMLIGDYASIQWHPERRQVRLARSALSMQPLHVWREGRRLVAASLPRSLIAAGFQPKIDPIKLEDSLLLNFSDARRSWYRGAHRVAAGSFEVHDFDGFAHTRHFAVDDVAEVRFTRDEEYVEALDEHFGRATRAELDGVQRPAIMLSGGLDSQCVASYLAELGEKDQVITSFTSVPQEGWLPPAKPFSFGNEEPFVRALAEQYSQIEPHFITGVQRRFGQDLNAMMELGGWPMRNESNLHWIHEAYVRARALDCDAMFYGANGNASFSYDGQTGYATWLREGDVERLLCELRMRPDDERSLFRKLLSLAVLPNLSFSVQAKIQALRGKAEDPFALWCPMRRAYAHESGAFDRAIDAGSDPRFPPLASSRAWRKWAIGELLCEGAEIDLAFRLHHGIEGRDPTLFQPLVEFTIGIADDQYLRFGEDRWLARRLLKGRVPEMVRQERRIGRQSPDWAQRFQRDRPQMIEELNALTSDNQLAEVLDLKRLSQDLESWDGKEDSQGIWKQKIHAGVSRALSTARFVRYVERRNVGF